MNIIGITGGIGSGKTTIAKFFEALGIPVYYADIEAKALMNRSKVIKRKLIEILGDLAYVDGNINRKYIASKVFSNDKLLKQINAIVHPKVEQHFKRWIKKQQAPFVCKESAIIFENNLQNKYDAIILVISNLEDRIQRVMKRDHSSRHKVVSIIENQMSDEKKIPLANYIIHNKTLADTKKQVKTIYDKLIKEYSC